MIDRSGGQMRDGAVRTDAVPKRPTRIISLVDPDERWRMIEETAQEGIWMIDAHNRVTYANDVVGRMLGYEVNDIVGGDLIDFMDEEAALIAVASLEERRQGADTARDFRCMHRDGSDVWVSVRAARTVADDGEYLGVLATVVDVTAVHAAEHDFALARSITLGIAAAESFETALHEVLCRTAEADGNWEYAEAWLPSVNRGAMRLGATWSRPDESGTISSAGRPFRTLPGAEYAASVSISGDSHRIDFGEAREGDAAGSHNTLAVPVKAAQEVVAVLVFFATRRGAFDERQAGRVESLASHLGIVLERKRAEDARLTAERSFHEFIDHMPAMVYMKSVDGRLLLHNDKAEELWSLTAAEATDLDAVDHDTLPLPASDAARTNDASVAASAVAHTFLETSTLPDGMHWYSSIRFPVFDASGDVYGVGAIIRDITHRKKVDEELSEAHRQLERRALHDSLTGLPNRAQLLERLASLDRSKALATALLFVDLDDFKAVNDNFGHAEGDELLRMAAARMRKCIRPGDMLARLGGDEFAVLLEGADTVAAESLARRIVEAMSLPFALGDQKSRVTASVGVAVGTIADTAPDMLLRFADTAMYEAKSKGKGRYASFDSALRDALALRAHTENDLREAIERGALELYYQPIVDLASGNMVAVEALVRWEHSDRGLLAPDDFLPLAEHTGLIVPLGAWVVREACRQASVWHHAHPHNRALVVSVNVAARQLEDPAFASIVSDALDATGLDPARLCLEITETAVMADSAGAQQAVEPLQELGIELAIDDFGTGYASLTYLRRLRADAVKIDRSFVDGLGRECEDTTVVSAVIGLAHAMGLSVTAEGIETAEQINMLREMGCEHAQGFLMSPPIPAGELTKRLADRWSFRDDG